MKEYKIDYELFNVEEIIKIINFFKLFESKQYKRLKRPPHKLLSGIS